MERHFAFVPDEDVIRERLPLGWLNASEVSTRYVEDDDFVESPTIINKTNWWTLEETGKTW